MRDYMLIMNSHRLPTEREGPILETIYMQQLSDQSVRDAWIYIQYSVIDL